MKMKITKKLIKDTYKMLMKINKDMYEEACKTCRTYEEYHEAIEQVVSLLDTEYYSHQLYNIYVDEKITEKEAVELALKVRDYYLEKQFVGTPFLLTLSNGQKN